MRSKQITKLIIPLFIAAAVLGFTSDPAHSQIKLKYAFSGSATNPIAKCIFVPLAKEIEAKSQNRIKVEMYFGRTGFASPRKAYQQLAKGITDMTYSALLNSPGKFPMTELVTMPFLVRNNVAATIAINKLVPKYLDREFAQIKLLSLFILGPYQLHMKDRIATLADIKGKRLRAIGALVIETLETYGALPVSLPLPAVYENLQKGVIDGTVSPFAIVPAFKMGEVTQSHLHMNLSGPVSMFGVSKKFYAGLPGDLKMIFDDLRGPGLGTRAAKCFQRVDGFGIKMAKKKGNSVVTLSKAEMAKAVAAVAPIQQRVLGELEKKGMKAREFYAALQKQIKIEEQNLRKK